jgi:hypothetical protein
MDGQHSVVALTGARGSGKTTLAADIAHQSGLQRIWIELAPGLNDRAESLLWQLARPLAQIAPITWRALHQIQQAGWDYPEVVRLQLILDGYARAKDQWLICVDGVEHALEPALRSLLNGLCDYVARTRYTQIELLLAGRVLPYRASLYALPALAGLPAEAFAQWAAHEGVAMSAGEAERVVARTGGLPKALALTLASYYLGSALEDPLRLSSIRRLISTLLDDLSPHERAYIKHLATLAEQPTRLDPESTTLLVALEDQHLVSMSADAIVIHPLIRSFFQHQRSSR